MIYPVESKLLHSLKPGRSQIVGFQPEPLNEVLFLCIHPFTFSDSPPKLDTPFFFLKNNNNLLYFLNKLLLYLNFAIIIRLYSCCGKFGGHGIGLEQNNKVKCKEKNNKKNSNFKKKL